MFDCCAFCRGQIPRDFLTNLPLCVHSICRSCLNFIGNSIVFKSKVIYKCPVDCSDFEIEVSVTGTQILPPRQSHFPQSLPRKQEHSNLSNLFRHVTSAKNTSQLDILKDKDLMCDSNHKIPILPINSMAQDLRVFSLEAKVVESPMSQNPQPSSDRNERVYLQNSNATSKLKSSTVKSKFDILDFQDEEEEVQFKFPPAKNVRVESIPQNLSVPKNHSPKFLYQANSNRRNIETSVEALKKSLAKSGFDPTPSRSSYNKTKRSSLSNLNKIESRLKSSKTRSQEDIVSLDRDPLECRGNEWGISNPPSELYSDTKQGQPKDLGMGDLGLIFIYPKVRNAINAPQSISFSSRNYA